MADSTDVTTALALGLLQGSTEFLPVSSSGHLAAYALTHEVPEMSLALTVLLHGATLLATLWVFRGDLLGLTRTLLGALRAPRALTNTEQGRLLLSLGAACVPTAVIGLALEPHMEALSGDARVVGVGFLLSAIAVVSTRNRIQGREELSVGAALLVGLAQGMAVLPGLSRSGTTIACALALGMSASGAFRFSFLVSIPVIAGATALELGKPGVLAGMGPTAWAAAAVTLVTGYACLRLLRGMLTRGHFWKFVWYLVPLGLWTLYRGLTGA